MTKRERKYHQFRKNPGKIIFLRTEQLRQLDLKELLQWDRSIVFHQSTPDSYDGKRLSDFSIDESAHFNFPTTFSGLE